jgi:hypothetical protein
MSNFRPIDRQTGFLMPPSVDERLSERHLARFVVEVVEGLDLRAMSGSYRRSVRPLTTRPFCWPPGVWPDRQPPVRDGARARLFGWPHEGGAPSRLSAEQQAQMADWVRAGPELEKDGVVRWRRIDLQGKIAPVFQVDMHERSVGKLLNHLGFRHISVRPRHPPADASTQQAHKKTSSQWSPKSSLRMPAASPSSFGGRTRHGSVSRAA